MKEGTSKPPPKKPILWIRKPAQVKQQLTPKIHILMLTYNNGVKQEVAKSNILECISSGEKVIL